MLQIRWRLRPSDSTGKWDMTIEGSDIYPLASSGRIRNRRQPLAEIIMSVAFAITAVGIAASIALTFTRWSSSASTSAGAVYFMLCDQDAVLIARQCATPRRVGGVLVDVSAVHEVGLLKGGQATQGGLRFTTVHDWWLPRLFSFQQGAYLNPDGSVDVLPLAPGAASLISFESVRVPIWFLVMCWVLVALPLARMRYRSKLTKCMSTRFPLYSYDVHSHPQNNLS
jgi:hypothetical protein